VAGNANPGISADDDAAIRKSFAGHGDARHEQGRSTAAQPRPSATWQQISSSAGDGCNTMRPVPVVVNVPCVKWIESTRDNGRLKEAGLRLPCSGQAVVVNGSARGYLLERFTTLPAM
jgi:hypothetical protein